MLPDSFSRLGVQTALSGVHIFLSYPLHSSQAHRSNPTSIGISSGPRVPRSSLLSRPEGSPRPFRDMLLVALFRQATSRTSPSCWRARACRKWTPLAPPCGGCGPPARRCRRPRVIQITGPNDTRNGLSSTRQEIGARLNVEPRPRASPYRPRQRSSANGRPSTDDTP
jgi:hypothetical protein